LEPTSIAFISPDNGGVTAPLIDINTATLEELDTLPGIGPTLAQAIIDYREMNGPFLAIEDIIFVDGIGPDKFELIKDLITVGI
jgi:competence protein ComEA